MLSFRHNFLFVHIPKTGGNSIQSVMAPYSEDKIVNLNPHQDGVERFEVRRDCFNFVKHSTLSEYSKALNKEIFTRLFKFTVIRNPWDRMISYYFSPHRGEVAWNREAFIKLLSEIKTDAHYLLIDQSKNFIDLDFILHFENLEEDFGILKDKLGLSLPELPIRNRSVYKPNNSYRDFYDSETRQMVANKFILTIDYFGYQF